MTDPAIWLSLSAVAVAFASFVYAFTARHDGICERDRQGEDFKHDVRNLAHRVGVIERALSEQLTAAKIKNLQADIAALERAIQ